MSNDIIRIISSKDTFTTEDNEIRRKTWEYQIDTWKHITEKLLEKLPAVQVVEMVLEVLHKVSDMQFKVNTGLFYYEEGLIKPVKEGKEQTFKQSSGITAKINLKINIIDLAKQYGLKVTGNKAICPFHNDTSPSLIFKNNCFKCWSSNCGKSGNVIDFIYEAEQVGLVRRKE